MATEENSVIVAEEKTGNDVGHQQQHHHKFSLGVTWEDFRYTIRQPKQEDLQILKGLSGTALPGRTLAVLGSSGAGKTTFLNALADRLRHDNTHILEGQMLLNDVPFEHKYRKLLGFVTQEDIVSPMATPEDAFRFSVRIRRGVDEETAEQLVDNMVTELKLTDARSTMVGIPGLISGLSGGEKKRTNIGIELISDPKVVLLDEPTSGLDSVSATRIVGLCRELARHGRTVIFSIHQPTADCVAQFDDLLLMCAGGVAYHGTMEESVPYFASVGYACPDNYTPTDHYMILLQDPEIGPQLVSLWSKRLETGYSSPHIKPTISPQAGGASPIKVEGTEATDEIVLPSTEETKEYLDNYVANAGSSVGIQFKELMRRSFTNVKRNKMFVAMSVMQSLFFAIVVGVMFVNLKDDVQGIQDRMGMLFMVSANRCFGGAMMVINTFPPEKAVFIREQQGGAYSPAIYFLAKSFSEMPVQFMGTLIETLIVYWAAGLVPDAGRYFHYLAITFATFQAATGLGMAISCLVPSFHIASGLAPLVMVPMMMAGGLLGSTDRLRPYWVWLEKISVVRYSFTLYAKNEFEGLDQIYCHPGRFPEINGTQFCERQPVTGQQVLDAYDWNGVDHSYWLMWVCLVAWFVVLRIVCILALNKIARSKE